jgi:hypothetical protein
VGILCRYRGTLELAIRPFDRFDRASDGDVWDGETKETYVDTLRRRTEEYQLVVGTLALVLVDGNHQKGKGGTLSFSMAFQLVVRLDLDTPG